MAPVPGSSPPWPRENPSSSRSPSARKYGIRSANRRPHAGAVLLLSLAVAVATLAICLQETSQRSQVDQANHLAGADVRLLETGSSPPADRAGQLVDIPGVREVLPAVQQQSAIGSGANSSVLMIDADRAGDVMRLRDDMTTQPPSRLFSRLAADRSAGLRTPLPAGATRLAGTLTAATSERAGSVQPIDVWADVEDRHGVLRRIQLGTIRPDAKPVTFNVKLGGSATALNTALRVGFTVGVAGAAGFALLAIGFVIVGGANARERMLARLGVLGLSRRQARRLLVWELAPLTGAALLPGVGLGVATPWLLAPGLGLENFSDGAPVRVVVDPVQIGITAGAVVVVVAAAIAIEAAVRRRAVAGALRMGDEQ